MITLPLQALAHRPAAGTTRAAAEPEGPSFGDVFERAQAPAQPATRAERHHAPGHDPVADRAARDDRPARPDRAGVAEHEPEHTGSANAGAPDEHLEPAAVEVDPGAMSAPTDGAVQHAAAATGLVAAGVVEGSNPDDPVAPAGLPSPSLAAVATNPDVRTTAQAAETVTAAATPDATGVAAPATGPVVTNVRIETIPTDPMAPEVPAADTASAAAPTAASAPAAHAARATTEPGDLLVAGTADGGRASDAAAAARTPNAAAATATGAPAASPGAAAATAAAMPTAVDDAPGADAAADPARPSTVPATPVRGDATTGTSTSAAPAAASGPAAGSPLAQGDGVTPSRLVDLVERAQRESQIRRAEHTTRLGMDVATEGLGSIRIEASNTGSGLHLNLGAERQATRQLLADQVNVLRDELGGAGVSVDVSTGRGHDTSHRQDGDRSAPDARTVTSSSSTTVPSAATRAPGHGRSAALHSLLAGQRGVDLHL